MATKRTSNDTPSRPVAKKAVVGNLFEKMLIPQLEQLANMEKTIGSGYIGLLDELEVEAISTAVYPSKQITELWRPRFSYFLTIVMCNSILVRKFLVYSSLLLFAILFTLRLDLIISFSYFFVFIPIWLGELLVFLGFFIGLISFFASPPPRADIGARNDFFAMCFCMLEHILLLMFELLCCYKLEYAETIDGKQLSWLLVFTPLFVQSFMAMIISVWSIRHDKSFEFEMYFAINIVQFVFVAFKLDDALQWNWVVVFVPTWVVFSLCFIGALYSLILAIFLARSVHLLSAHRRSHMFNAISHILLMIPLMIFFLLLSSKLDAFTWLDEHSSRIPYVIVSCPLFISLFFWLLMSFGSKNGNSWWFGMRQPCCQVMFTIFPFLKQYANISYKFGYRDERATAPPPRSLGSMPTAEHIQMLPNAEYSGGGYRGTHSSTFKVTAQVYSIESPD